MVVSIVEPLSIGLVLAGTISTLVSGSCLAWCLLRTQPGQLLREVKRASETCALALRTLESIELRQAAWKEELDGYQSAVDDSLARAETKMRRAETSERRGRGRQVISDQPADPAELPRAEQIAWARSRLAGMQ